MITEIKQKEFQDLIRNATHEEIAWMSGFLQGILFQNHSKGSLSNSKSLAISSCTILYGTETGNSKKLASDFAGKLKKLGMQIKLKSMDQYRFQDLLKEKHLLIVISTHGDGEPPQAAKKFYDYIHTENLSLSQLHYAVAALGDSAYPLFCKTGEDIDRRFEQLNASRMANLRKCDIEFENDAHTWLDELVEKSFYKNQTPQNAEISPSKIQAASGRKTNNAKVLVSINLNDETSNKETFHIELETESPIDYQPGDALGIIPKNKAALVCAVLQLLGLQGLEKIEFKGTIDTAENLLSNKISLLQISERVLVKYASLVKKEIPSLIIDLADLLTLYPPEKNKSVSAQEIISILEPIKPRLYSISSSPSAHGQSEVHLTVSQHRFRINSEDRFGLCSNYLTTLQHGDVLNVYVQKNAAFKLPSADVDIIMIGPGTGIAPFRSFLFERDAAGGSGRNWLFFGDQHFVTDFLYQTELQSFIEMGSLTKLNTAFSRDQKEKIYVQHKLMQQADELMDWLDKGAHIYICGAKEPMSIDVENTLLQILSKKKNIALTQAENELKALANTGRYHKDVY